MCIHNSRYCSRLFIKSVYATNSNISLKLRSVPCQKRLFISFKSYSIKQAIEAVNQQAFSKMNRVELPLHRKI